MTSFWPVLLLVLGLLAFNYYACWSTSGEKDLQKFRKVYQIVPQHTANHYCGESQKIKFPYSHYRPELMDA